MLARVSCAIVRFFLKFTKHEPVKVGLKNAEFKNKKVKIKPSKETEDEAQVRARVLNALSNHSLLARKMYQECERLVEAWEKDTSQTELLVLFQEQCDRVRQHINECPYNAIDGQRLKLNTNNSHASSMSRPHCSNTNV